MKNNHEALARVGKSRPALGGLSSSLIPHPSSFMIAAVCAAALVLLAGLAFPPFNQAWAVLVFLVPFVKWSFARPRWRTYLPAAFLAGWGAWFVILFWLRHIYPPWGLVALALLSATLGLFWLAWLAAMRWAAPRLDGAARWKRMAGLFALAGWWVVLDWVRGWLFTGFPWAPLASAFWKFPLFLQPLQWTGTWGVTFAIVLFNLGVVCGTGPEMDPDDETPPPRKIFWPARVGLELLAPIVLFIGAVLLASVLMNNSHRSVNKLLRVGVVQPATPPLLKWDDADRADVWETLTSLTQKFAYRNQNPNNVDLVLWPESAPPFPIQGPEWKSERDLVVKFASQLGTPLLLGAVGEATPASGQKEPPGYIDGVFLAEPGKGIAKEVYAKRHLVPFGEYNPLPSWLPFDAKVVQFFGDTVPGDRAVTIPLLLSDNQVTHLGPLVCYEDVFSRLARDQVKAGADLLVVVTNDAWFGTGGGALQHAAQSVLRAIETRRPILRCGNQGWSGFIDQDGNAFELDKTGHVTRLDWVLTARGTTYFRGTGAYIVYTNPQFDGQETFYVRHGDWFVALSALLMAFGGFVLRRRPQ